MKTVWKYPIGNDSTLNLPKGTQVLSVNMKNKNLCLWCLVDSDEREYDQRRFMTFKTNDNIVTTLNYKYIGSTGIIQDMMFFHTFEVIP